MSPAHDLPAAAAALLDPARGPLEVPIRSEIFGAARFQRHGRSLAETHEARPRAWRTTPFFPRLRDNVRMLREAQRYIGAQSEAGVGISPAGEWLLDNFHLVEAQLGQIHAGLPRRYFRHLPVLAHAHMEGLPRVYGVAWAFVAHTDAAFDADLLGAYLGAYQETRELSHAELWALPTTLRVVLVENLRRLAERVAVSKAARELANLVADRSEPPAAGELDALLAGLEARGAAAAFLVQLWQRSHDGRAAAPSARQDWLARHLGDPAAALEAQQAEQAANNLSVGNVITALRGLGNADWRGLIGRVSTLMRLLDGLPVHHAECDDTQDETLHGIEALARRCRRSETEVARTLIGLMPAPHDADAVSAAPAYWLRGAGRAELHRALGRRAPWPAAFPRLAQRLRLAAYLGAIGLGTAALAAGLLMLHPLAPGAAALALALLLLPCSEAVVAMVNRVISESARPRRLPALALPEGVAADQRTLVAMPCLIGSADGARALVRQLERHFLANRQPHVQFALLSDLPDADAERTDADDGPLDAAREAVAALNERHPAKPGEAPTFLLLHRPRCWSASEGRWIGWERKRGKLEQLIDAIVAAPTGRAAAAAFLPPGALAAVAPDTRYLLTLDADTDLPPGRLADLVGIAAHPLNRPRIDMERRRVVAGHAILQPRVTTPLPEPGAVTPYHWLYAGQCGIDPYSAASSEVYQDVFDEGSFVGKGLLDVRALHAVLGGRLPEGQVLSHDLLEGALARCAGVSEVTVVEDAPVHADVAASRVHRWTRGDWQLLPFLLRPRRWPLGAINRWKMLDNLRRSLVAPAALVLLVAALTTGLVSPWAALVLVALAFCAGPLMGAIAGLAPSRDAVALGYFWRHAGTELLRALAIGAWSVVQLLENALLQADAIVRALWRLAVSRRRLLEWTPAAAAEAAATTDLRTLWRRHARVSVVALVLGGGLLAAQGPAPGLAVALCLAWALSPALTAWASRPRPHAVARQLDAATRDYLGDIGRDTWRLFERCIGPEDHHLPPDNLQIAPYPIVAHRTSPTNIGLYLLATCCARRFGWIGTTEAVERLEATLATVARLPRHRGHLYNWIDTGSLQVLAPGYVSTVDSGNLCGHLVAVAMACREAAGEAAAGANALAAPRAALAASSRRIAAALPLLEAIGHSTALRELVALPDALGLAAHEPQRFAHLVDAAAHELDRLLAGLGGGETDSAGAGLRGGLLQHLQDHLRTLRSAERDIAATPAGPGLAPRLHAIAATCERLAWEPEFGFLYDRRRRLLHIGYRVAEQQLDASYYDLLASEARLTSLIGIAKGELPVAHWAALGRPFYAHGPLAGLKSWSGSMFEYLMPTLVLDEPHDSALQRAGQVAVEAQIAHGRHEGLPWGVSESAYAASDHTLAYQYAPQGVPQLALRRTPGDERVVAPYATLLAAMVAPRRAGANLRALEAAGARDEYGFIEALDYTAARQTGDGAAMRVATFMAHHQGMAIVALANVLLQGTVRRWAMADPHLQAVVSLLHERAPREIARAHTPPPAPARTARPPGGLRQELVPGDAALPPTHLLSNGRHTVALRANGAGWSRWSGLDVSRSRDDLLRDAHGHFVWLRRPGPATPVSVTAHPAPDPAARYGCSFHADRVRYEADWDDLEVRCTVWVSPEDDIELRQVELRNVSDLPIEIELMSCFEVALSDPRADEAHPAFANLFVRAHWDATDRALYLERKPRLPGEAGVQAVHFVADLERHTGPVRVLTDRALWQGRNRERNAPRAAFGAAPLYPGVEPVTGLDPVAALAVPLQVPAHGKARVTFATAVARERAELEARVDAYLQPAHIERSSLMSSTLAAIRLREMDVQAENFAAIQTLTTLLLTGVACRLPTVVVPLPADRRALWRHGISGDRPIVLVYAGVAQSVGLVRALVQALRLWARCGVACDLVVVNAEPSSYLMPLQRELIGQRERVDADQAHGEPAARVSRLHLLRAAELSAEETAALEMLARVRFNADGRSLPHHVKELVDWHAQAQRERRRRPVAELALVPAQDDGDAPVGTFDADSGEFRFEVDPARRPARPWINVLSNPAFGAQVSESGAGYTWAGNSRLHQLTPWSNDPVGDAAGEWLLLHDPRSGTLWNAGAAGLGADPVALQVRHGQGTTTLTQQRGELTIEATWAVDIEFALKWVRLRLVNAGRKPVRLRLVALAEWQMGAGRADRLTVHTGSVLADGMSTLLATQRDGHAGHGQATAFLALRPAQADAVDAVGWTCDRRELFDARGRLVVPAELGRAAGAGLDPCAALAGTIEVDAQDSAERVLVLGHADSPEAARELARRAARLDVEERLAAIANHWDTLLGAVTVASPDPLFDAFVNRWLLYQTVACRLWSRAGFYQAGGAFGFRDQLQDALALAGPAPGLLRAQIVRCAARQFPEGDVQHWWHEPGGAGVRTHISDDRLWLPHAIVHYLETTGDQAVLDEEAPFLAGRPIPPGAEDVYESPAVSEERASVYEHAARAIDCSLTHGAHGLPLIGSGDWNDGMNRVGHEGRGESVWLAWFAGHVVAEFAPLARARGEADRAGRWEAAALRWRQALRTAGWDGDWYRRAFFDDGAPLGSHVNRECRIDLIAQAWAVLGVDGPAGERAESALHAAERLLVDDAAGVVRLLDPPLAQAEPNAGYIQAYPGGVRENGGQYSHGGVWALMAAARLGRADLAWRLWTLLSPAHRSAHSKRGPAYQIEPYVMAGDVCTQPPYVGRGGWSWYTGSAAWMWRAAIESICGLRRRGEKIRLDPQLPPHWSECRLTLRRDGQVHHIVIVRQGAQSPGALAARAEAERHGAVELAPRRWSVLRAPWVLVVLPEASSYTARAVAPMEAAPPAA
jgi:cyclic beta-1,2-glucan synthetase